MKKLGFLFVLIPMFGIAQIEGDLLLGLTPVTTTEIATIGNAIEGSLVYNSTLKKMMLFDGDQWVEPLALPPDLLDGDDNTTYSAGSGLALSGTIFSVNHAAIMPNWNNITNIPTNLDLDATNEIQLLSKTGTDIILSNGGGIVSETETHMTQDTASGIITYTGESGGTSAAKVVSDDPNNSIAVGSDGGAFLEQTVTTTTVLVDQSYIWSGVVNDPDIHSNGTLTVNQNRADTGWSFAAPSTIAYAGTPDHVKIDLMAVVNNTGSHYPAPHIRVFRNGQQIGEGGAYYLDDSNFFSGRMTINLNLVDVTPGTDPVYTFTTLEDDTQVMNNATITSLSPVSLIAVEKVAVVTSISN